MSYAAVARPVRPFRSGVFAGALALFAIGAFALWAHADGMVYLRAGNEVALYSGVGSVHLFDMDAPFHARFVATGDPSSSLFLQVPGLTLATDLWSIIWVQFLILPLVGGLVSHWWHFDDTLPRWQAVIATAPAVLVGGALVMFIIAAIAAVLGSSGARTAGLGGWGNEDDDAADEADADYAYD